MPYLATGGLSMVRLSRPRNQGRYNCCYSEEEMTTGQDGFLADWYSRVVFGVIAVSLAMLALQGACTVPPVMRAKESECGARFNPCYVEVLGVAGTVDVAEPVNVVVLNK